MRLFDCQQGLVFFAPPAMVGRNRTIVECYLVAVAAVEAAVVAALPFAVERRAERNFGIAIPPAVVDKRLDLVGWLLVVCK